MNSLSRTLQWLKLPRTNSSCHIIVSPDPRKFQGYQRVATGLHEFRLKFEADLNVGKYVSENPSFGFASNGVSRPLPSLPSSNQSDYSEWVKIVETTRKTEGDKTLREVLVDILDKFPKYDLHSEKGVTEAIGDIEASLKPVATFDEVEGH